MLTSLLTNAGHNQDMNYVSLVLNTAKEENIELDPKFVLTLKKIVTEEKKNRYLLNQQKTGSLQIEPENMKD